MKPLLTLLLCGLVGSAVSAAPINLGVFTYRDYGAGTTGFNIENFTGTPLCVGPCAVPSDFPVHSILLFNTVTVDVLYDGAPPVSITLQGGSALGPGSHDPSPLQMPSSSNLLSATLKFFLSSTSLTLEDGSQLAGPGFLSITMNPSAGSLLAADADFSLISFDPAASIPEPASLPLLVPVLLAIVAGARHRKFAAN